MHTCGKLHVYSKNNITDVVLGLQVFFTNYGSPAKPDVTLDRALENAAYGEQPCRGVILWKDGPSRLDIAQASLAQYSLLGPFITFLTRE